MMQNKGCAGAIDLGHLVFQEVVVYYQAQGAYFFPPPREGLNL